MLPSDSCCRTSRFSLINRFVSLLVTCWSNQGITSRVINIERADTIVRSMHKLDVDILAHLFHNFVWRKTGALVGI